MSTSKALDLTHVPQLDGSNYQEWKLRVSLVLKATEIWEAVDGTSIKPVLKTDNSNTTQVSTLVQKDAKAQAVVVNLVTKRQLSH
jgi:hypothetical protein